MLACNRSSSRIEVATGPVLLREVALARRQEDRVLVLNSSYFYPLSWRKRESHSAGETQRMDAHGRDEVEVARASGAYALTFWTHSWGGASQKNRMAARRGDV